jgi:4'-phosphopantetheinyl transferase
MCEVWVADIALCRPEHDGLLDDAERARAERFVHLADRSKFVLGVALLKLAVGATADLEPESVHVIREARGRPRVADSDLNVSVSHSGSVVAVALTRAGEVGIDVETRHPDGLERLGERIATPSERVSDPSDLLVYWCRKESVLKATGEGLRLPMQEVIVSPPGEAARLVSYRGARLDATMTDLDIAGARAAALTVLTGEPVEVVIRPGAPLLWK